MRRRRRKNRRRTRSIWGESPSSREREPEQRGVDHGARIHRRGSVPSGRAVARARCDSVAAAFQDEVEKVRSAAVAAIGALDSKFEYGDQLAEVAFGDVDAHVRREALTAMKAYE